MSQTDEKPVHMLLSYASQYSSLLVKLAVAAGNDSIAIILTNETLDLKMKS